MFRFVILLVCLVLVRSHAVVPLVAPAVHSVHVPVVASYHGLGHGLGHGYGHGLGYGFGHGLGHGYGLGYGYGHGGVIKPLGHHVFKRSPHGLLGHVESFGHGHLGHVAAVAPIAHVAQVVPAAVSHQSRVDVHTSPAVVKHVVAAPLLAFGHGLGGGHLGAGHLGGHFGESHLGAGYLGGHLGGGHLGGHLGAGHLGYGHYAAGHGYHELSHLGHY